MIGTARMRNLRTLTQRVLDENIPGDLIETGVWRGGACIYMRGILAAAGDTKRRVFVADSFRGLPPPNETTYPADAGDPHHTFPQLAICRTEVEANFRRYGLLDDQVIFLEGWFKDTLPTAPIDQLAVLRLDGDMYESTMDALNALYGKVSPGGFVIVDDYVLKACNAAVEDFRRQQGISAPMHEVDGAAVWWQVSSTPNQNALAESASRTPPA
jgi:O-methyltransferase